MKKFLKFAAVLAILLMVMALFTGCKVTGGGYFTNTARDNEKEKCTFGFNAQGEGIEYKGQFQFNDHAKPATKIHAEVLEITSWGDTYAQFTGLTDEGFVYVEIWDNGEPGAVDDGDYIKIYVNKLPFGNPTYEGELGGGNIQIHE